MRPKSPIHVQKYEGVCPLQGSEGNRQGKPPVEIGTPLEAYGNRNG